MVRLTSQTLYGLLGVALWLALAPTTTHATTTPAQAWNKGMALYNAYEFTKASAWIRKTLQKPPASWKKINKAYALVILSLCQMNLAKIKLARRMYLDALNLSRDVMLPTGLPENVKARYTAMRAEWLKAHPIQKKNSLLKKPKKQRKRTKRVKQRSKPKTQKTLAKKKGKKPQKKLARTTKRTLPKAPSKLPFRYTGSVVVLSLAGAALIGAISLGVVSSGHASTVAQADRNAPDSAATIGNAYNSALSTGIASTVMWVVGPALGAVGIGLLIYDAGKKIYAPRAALGAPRTPHNPTYANHARLLLVTP